jgi:hypothetical protein
MLGYVTLLPHSSVFWWCVSCSTVGMYVLSGFQTPWHAMDLAVTLSCPAFFWSPPSTLPCALRETPTSIPPKDAGPNEKS